MWLRRQLCDLLRIEHPIIQAPMAGSVTPELASAVSDAGGLGSLGCGEMASEAVREAVLRMRAGTDRPFNLNFFVHSATSGPGFEFLGHARSDRRRRPRGRMLARELSPIGG